MVYFSPSSYCLNKKHHKHWPCALYCIRFVCGVWHVLSAQVSVFCALLNCQEKIIIDRHGSTYTKWVLKKYKKKSKTSSKNYVTLTLTSDLLIKWGLFCQWGHSCFMNTPRLPIVIVLCFYSRMSWSHLHVIILGKNTSYNICLQYHGNIFWFDIVCTFYTLYSQIILFK